MRKQGGGLCLLGPDDKIPNTPDAQSFSLLKIGELDVQELKFVQFNQAEYNDARIEAGYICEKEGNDIRWMEVKGEVLKATFLCFRNMGMS